MSDRFNPYTRGNRRGGFGIADRGRGSYRARSPRGGFQPDYGNNYTPRSSPDFDVEPIPTSSFASIARTSESIGKRKSATAGPGPKRIKEQKITGLQTSPILLHFEVDFQPTGIQPLSNAVFSAMHGRDSRMTALITQLQLEYVTSLAYANRIIQLGIDLGIRTGIPDASVIKSAARGIQLPLPLIKYVDAIGAFKLLSGITTVPYVYTRCADMFRLGRTPAQILRDAGRPVPLGEWSIDPEWISEWNQNTTRMSRQSMKFCTIDYTNTEGRVESICSFRAVGGMFTGYSPMLSGEHETTLGAIYRYRSQDALGAHHPQLLYGTHETRDFDPTIVWSDVVVNTFTTRDEK